MTSRHDETGVHGPARDFADALIAGEAHAIAAQLTPHATFWSLGGARVPAQSGADEVAASLAALVGLEAPTRVRLLRNGEASMVLSAFADERALWSLEIAIEGRWVDVVMLWMPESALSGTAAAARLRR